MMNDKVFYYIWAYVIVFLAFFVGLWVLLGLVILILSFVTWSLPVSSPFAWWVFRIVLVLSIILTCLCYDGCKGWVEETMRKSGK